MISLVNVLTEEEVSRVRAIISDVPPTAWQDGKETAGALIKHRKSNQQMRDVPEEITKIIHEGLVRNTSFANLTMPNKISKLMISKYTDTDGYGYHVDNACMANERRDVSLSLMLSDPKSYDGGELVFNFGSVRTGVKPAAGQAVLFPSQLEHSVKPVIGERLVCIAWITSVIADQMTREMVYRLTRVIDLLPEITKDVPLDSPEREEVVSAIAFVRENIFKSGMA
jgi:PKHD-type hydroxylase